MTADHPAANHPAVPVPAQLPEAIIRPRDLVQAVLAQSLQELGSCGRAALAWNWVLAGTRPSPITLSLPPGQPPSRAQIHTEASAPPEGSTAPPGVPAGYCDQLAEARHILAWLIGDTDEIPLDDDNRGRFIGARDDYARTDTNIRTICDQARHSLQNRDLPEHMDPGSNPRRWPAEQMYAAWLSGAADLLDWVLGERPAAPLSGHYVHRPAAYDLTYEDASAEEVARQGRPGGPPADPARYPPPQYAEAIQATIGWLRGRLTSPPVDQYGCGVYAPGPGG